MNYLFICNGNVARSQEAEAFYNKLTDSKNATSAGINVKIGKPIDPFVLEVMNEIGVDLSKAVRKLVDMTLVDHAEAIVSFKPYDELPDFLQNRNDVVFWSVPDPQHQSVEFHRKVRDSVKGLVTNLISQNQK